MVDLMEIANLLDVRIEEKGGISLTLSFLVLASGLMMMPPNKKGNSGRGDTLVFGDWTYMGRLSALGVCIRN